MVKILIIAILCFPMISAIAEECSFLNGWSGIRPVTNLTTQISQILSAEATPSSTRYRTPCQKALAQIVVAYDAIRDLGRKDYERYRARTLSDHFASHPMKKKFDFLSKYIMSGQVQNTWEEYKRLAAANNPQAANKKAQVMQFMLNKYRRLAADQRALLPDGPTIIPLANVRCAWRSEPSNYETLAYEGAQVPTGSYCSAYQYGRLESDPYPYQHSASTLGFEIKDNQIVAHYCEQENQVERRTAGAWIFEYTRHVINSNFKCISYNLSGSMFLTSDARDLNLNDSYSRNVNNNFDEVENHYQRLLAANPNLPNKIKTKDEWWQEQKQSGKAPTFNAFFTQHYPTSCPAMGTAFTIQQEDRRALDDHPPFWYFDDVGASRPE